LRYTVHFWHAFLFATWPCNAFPSLSMTFSSHNADHRQRTKFLQAEMHLQKLFK
jgi:hypothetical protein